MKKFYSIRLAIKLKFHLKLYHINQFQANSFLLKR